MSDTKNSKKSPFYIDMSFMDFMEKLAKIPKEDIQKKKTKKS